MARHEQRVIDTRIGQRAVARDKFIRFPQGLIGFENNREFVLLQLSEGSPFLILQSTTNVAVGLVVADPFTFLPDFEIKIGEAEKNVLQLDDIHQVAVLVTVSIPHGEPEKNGPELVRADISQSSAAYRFAGASSGFQIFRAVIHQQPCTG